jgi:SAM-dependent methyltransferase
MSTTPNSAAVYYSDKYWNDHQLTRDLFTRRMSGGSTTPHKWWHAYLFEEFLKNKPAKKALILNCGNGWVERELYDLGIFESAVGFDYSEDLLTTARTLGGNRSLSYFQADCNKVEFEPDSFDLVINFAAMHHVQLINRMNCLIANALSPNGYFVNFDYIGPHRNQYGGKLFGTMEEINQILPDGFRASPFIHPCLTSMLAADPTEAIHSELVMPMFYRYFYPLERRDLNGGIAYQIMHNNRELFLNKIALATECVKFLLEADEVYSNFELVPPLFSFFIGRPKKELFAPNKKDLLNEWKEEETKREQSALKNGGIY